MPKYELNSLEYKMIENGNPMQNNTGFDNQYILLTNNNKLVSLAKISDNLIKPKKIFKEIE